MKASARNLSFEVMVGVTKKTPYAQRIVELRAFASGAGCVLKFDETGFELWSNSSHSARLLCRVA